MMNTFCACVNAHGWQEFEPEVTPSHTEKGISDALKLLTFQVLIFSFHGFKLV